MENKINIAELLKDCPKGMELDCTMYNKVTLLSVDNDKDRIFPIKVLIEDGSGIMLTKYGQYTDADFAKCIIFPKGKTTWEGFVPPHKFKDGDVLYIDCTDEDDDKHYDFIFIFKEIYNGKVHSHCFYYIPKGDFQSREYCNAYLTDDKYPIRFATEEEKAKLFQVIKDKGYKWNAETKTLEELIEPIFEVGNKIEKCGYRFTIAEVKDDYYLTKCGNKIPIYNQDDFSLVPDKFDITTLKPFDKVLVRGDVGQKWTHDFFGFMDKDKGCPFVCVGHYVIQCIPYDKNEHLLGTIDDCDDYYKTWE